MTTNLKVRTFTWRAALDNYPVTRNWANGQGECYHTTHDDADTFTVHGLNDVTGALESNYIIDDGTRTQILYVAGYSEHRDDVYLKPFPVNPDGARQPDGRAIDYSTWALGPRRAYHLKIIWKD